MDETLEKLRLAAEQVPAEQVPYLLGELRKVEARLMQRLFQPPPAPAVHPAFRSDELLDISQTAAIMKTTEDWLYRNWKALPFARKYGFGLRFSSKGPQDYIQRAGKV